jgi:hypothetical protein
MYGDFSEFLGHTFSDLPNATHLHEREREREREIERE